MQAGALTTAELCDALGLQELKNRKWHVQGSIAIKGEGLYEVLHIPSSAPHGFNNTVLHTCYAGRRLQRHQVREPVRGTGPWALRVQCHMLELLSSLSLTQAGTLLLSDGRILIVVTVLPGASSLSSGRCARTRYHWCLAGPRLAGKHPEDHAANRADERHCGCALMAARLTPVWW